jgi:hypothetical protein
VKAAKACAARLRGGFVGGTSAAVAVGAHGAGGATVPGAGSVVLALSVCAVIGAIATTARGVRGFVPLLALVGAGQVIGHCTLVFASGHAHGAHWSAAMVSAHVVAAVICAALICAAEGLCEAVVRRVRRIVVMVLDVTGDDGLYRPAPPPLHHRLVPRLLVRSAFGTRGPPASAVFA